ncbi:MAG: shikimate dehydrogenase [SAR86 cluster bacterium]|uniref:Shikimate dehydrogenase (NADP(+)) n=1 Tax=SAR86 cluster bacterium TaxID=2030880 RepID=A0A2A5CIF2_9GAMM|nr:shikimate dehydrogenase [Gammaproteobacteria bacterium AH-315-E17]PCJ43533.1 MAG: shikimate dehydrogenase [SAR86 cluster bacterium]
MDRYAVMGNPIGHSFSPRIHSAFADETDQQLSYNAMLVGIGEFPQESSRFFSEGGKGLNVTVPFKQEAWALAEELSSDAEIAGAVNTLFKDQDGRLQGHNTDGLGLVRDIKNNHSSSIEGKNVLVLGAGGATRGILLPLLREQPLSICIANRTRSKAEELAVLFSAYGNVSACGLEDLKEKKGGQKKIDWIINASSASLQGELTPISAETLSQDAICYDLMYAQEETVFCQWARQAGAIKVMDGIGMLVEQAAESFYLWRGIRPNTASVIQSLKKVI